MRAQIPEGAALDAAACDAIRQQAWSRLSQGAAAEALNMPQELLAALQRDGLAGGEDHSRQMALSYHYLARIYYGGIHRPDLALEPAGQAIARYEKLGDLDNLAAALGDQANALRALGRFAEALSAAEHYLEISRKLGHQRNVAVALDIIAEILREQGRYAETQGRHAEALQTAQAAGDLGLQGTILQHLGTLHLQMNQPAQAVEWYHQAITVFQRTGGLNEEMTICDLLASAERVQGRLESAAAWYARSRELALQLDDRYQLAIVAQNTGILYQVMAEREADPERRAARLRQAAASVQESLEINLEMQNQIGAAASYSQLGVLHLMLDELDQAEEYLQQSLHIFEPLNHPEVSKVYANLAEITRARGDTQAAAGWQAKRDAKEAELERLARGEGAEAQSNGGAGETELFRFVLALAQQAYQARASRAALDPQAAEALAQLCEAPAPLGDLGLFLQAVAEGAALPPIPPGLPGKVQQVLEALKEQIENE